MCAQDLDRRAPVDPTAATTPQASLLTPGAPLPAKQRWSLRVTFAALRHPRYRLWFAGQIVSLFGTWMQVTAQGFLVYELTRSPAYLGYVGFAAGLPAWVFTLYGGVVADRKSRRSLLIVTQSLMMLLAFILATLTFAGVVRPSHIIALAFGLGMVNAFDAPARQAFVVELVPREDLTNAIALNSTMFNIGTTVGPATAGIVYAAFGPAWCFAVNGLSFTAVLAALWAMHLPPLPRLAAGESASRELVRGLAFAARHRTIRLLLFGLAMTSLFGFSMMTLMPAWAADVLHGDASTNGWLLSARGLGSLFGALMVASVGRSIHKGRLLTAGMLVLPFVMLLFARAPWLPVSLAALVAAGFAFIVFFNMTNALVQAHVPDELRGRVMSIYTLTFFALMPLGSLLSGTIAARAGAPTTITLGALVLLGYTILIRLRAPELRRLA